MLVVLAELHIAGVAAVVRVWKRMVCDSKEVQQHARKDSIYQNCEEMATIGTKTYGNAAPGR
jgi:hypothetical protein